MARTHASARGRHRQDRAARAVNPLNAGILAALADGPLDTDELMSATRLSLGVLSQRLQRLKAAAMVEMRGRRRKRRALCFISVGVWVLAAERTADGRMADPRVAGRIVIGRGSRWGASLL